MGLPASKLGKTRQVPYNLVIDQFSKGYYSYFDQTRLPNDASGASQNLMQKEDGIWVTRPGTLAYGPTLTGSIDGAKEAVIYNNDGTTAQRLFIHHNGQLDYCIDGGALTNVTTGLTNGYNVSFVQNISRLYAGNGYDPFGYVDLTNMTWNTFAAIGSPGMPSATLNGALTNAGSNTQIYAVTAVNKIGQTLGSTPLTLTLNKERGSWTTSGTTIDSLDLSWTAVTGAEGYLIYTGTALNNLQFLASETSTKYHDDGQAALHPDVPIPTQDTTTGPKGAVMDLAMGRFWLCQDYANIHRVYCGGVNSYAGSLSPFHGGVYVDIGKGTNERPIAVKDYRTATGAAAAMVWTATPSGAGGTYIVQLASQTVGNYVIVIPQVTKVSGSIGTNAPRTITDARNSQLYMSSKGGYSVGNRPNIPNILSTDELTVNIRNNVANINNLVSSKMCGGYWQGKWWVSCPVGSTQNSEIWILDLEHLNWSRPFTIGVKQFLEYTDSGGIVHWLGIPSSGTQLIEFLENQFSDQGIAFETKHQTGIIPVGESHNDWAQIDYAYVELGRALGAVTFTLYGTEYGKDFGRLTAPKTYNFNTNAFAGYSTFVYSNHMFTDMRYVPKVISKPTIMKTLRVFKTVKDLMFEITSNDGKSFYKILRYSAKGRIVKRQDPTTQFS